MTKEWKNSIISEFEHYWVCVGLIQVALDNINQGCVGDLTPAEPFSTRGSTELSSPLLGVGGLGGKAIFTIVPILAPILPLSVNKIFISCL